MKAANRFFLMQGLLILLLVLPLRRLETALGWWLDRLGLIAGLVCVIGIVAVYVEITWRGLRQFRRSPAKESAPSSAPERVA